MKSSIMVTNTAIGVDIAADSVYPIPQIARRAGRGINGNNEGIVITTPGLYDIDVNVTATAGEAGVLTAQAYQNGVAIPGAFAAATAADGSLVTLPIKTIVRVSCCGNPSIINIKLGGIASTSYNAVLTAEEI